jgi:hypothetical protein
MSKRTLAVWAFSAILVTVTTPVAAQQMCVYCHAQAVEVPPYPKPYVVHFYGCCESSGGGWECISVGGNPPCPTDWSYEEEDLCSYGGPCVPPLATITQSFERAIAARDIGAITAVAKPYLKNVSWNSSRSSIQLLDCKGEVEVNIPVADTALAIAIGAALPADGGSRAISMR